MIGRIVGHYRVGERIGAGGMGVVHLAHDEHLRRRVALKFLPPGTLADVASRQRLRAEALALSRLAHPSIATLHDYLTDPEYDCLVMEYVEGESLDRILERGPLPEDEVLRLGAQLADGLAAAHAAGVIHRDIKPGNLRVNTEGRLKILDFGLAKRASRSLDSTSLATPEVPGELTGTFPYIAPELWRGDSAGPASDLYAIGVVLYEMATGTRPFADLSGSALVHALREVDPARPRTRVPGISAELDAIVMRCLARDPARRFESAGALFQALEALRSERLVSRLAPAAAARRSRHGRWPIALAGVTGALLVSLAWWLAPGARFGGADTGRAVAVLPFANLSGDPGQDWFVDGMTDELISRLAEVPAMRVISRTSVMRFRGASRPLPEIARSLGVGRIVQGSVQCTGDRIRVSVQLIDGPRDRHLWSRHYPGLRDDAQVLQDEIVADLERVLGVAAPAGAVARREAARVDPVAYNLVLQGRYHLARRGDAEIRVAIGCFEDALRRDSMYAAAYAGLADAWSAEAFGGHARPGDAYPRARRSAERALDLDPHLSEGWASLANIQQNYDWDWNAAARSFSRALELNPNNATAHHWYANHLALRGDVAGAEREIALARGLDPYSLPIAVGVGAFLYFARRYEAADRAYAEAAKLDSASGLLRRAMAANDDRLGHEARAVRDLCTWLRTARLEPLARDVEAAQARDGFGGALRVLLGGLTRKRAAGQYEPAEHLAELYARLGEREEAFRWLATAAAEHDVELNRLGVDPVFDSLRGDPRFDALLRRVGLAAPPPAGGTAS